MANQSSARIKGDDYQHLVSWYHVLSLIRPNTDVISVGVEDPNALSVDDVTVYRNNGAITTAEFYQIKYHVDQRDHYTIDRLLDSSKGTSLLGKFWKTWNKLKKTLPKEAVQLHLVSNWSASPIDDLLSLIDGEDSRLSRDFFEKSTNSNVGKEKEKVRVALNTDNDTLNDFFKSLHFDLGEHCTQAYKMRVSERMEWLKLKHDENALLVATGTIRNWIKDQTSTIDLKTLEETLTKADLYVPNNTIKTTTVYITTVKDHKFEIPPDYLLDWRTYFEKQSNIYGHELNNNDDWNNVLLPELHSLEERINKETGAHFIRARGFARLSAWFAFGFTFSEVSGYQIEVSQQDKLWRSDEAPTSNFNVISENGDGELYDQDFSVVAVGISVSGSLSEDVRMHISTLNGVKALLLLRPEKDLGRECLVEAGDVTALVDQVKTKIRNFVKSNSANKLLLYYFGPLSAACFLGHQLNAVCKEIQIFENITGGEYIASFILK